VAKKATSKKGRAASAKKTAKKTVKKAGGASKRSATKAPRKATSRRTAGKASAVKSSPTTTAGSPPKKAVKVKSGLRKNDLEKFRQMLLEKRRGLLGDMSGIEAETIGNGRKEGASELSNMPTHPADLGTDNYEHEFSLGLLESERAMLAEIDEALGRIGEGTYGICLGTGKPIGKARLNARPWAKYCIEYARLIEKGLVRPGQEDQELDG